MQRASLLAIFLTYPALAAEQVPIGQDSAEQADWDSLYKGSFSDSGEEPQTVTEVVTDGHDSLLLGVTSLPVMVTFGPNQPEASQPSASLQQGADPRTSLMLELGSCQLLVQTGPIQIAHYEEGAGTFSVLRDSLPPRTELSTPMHGSVYLAANAELAIEIPEASREACARQFAGRFVPLGHFSLARSVIEFADASNGSIVPGRAVTQDSSEQLFLMWPSGLETPMLLDNQGTHPDIETGVRQLSHPGAGRGIVRVKPQLERVGEGLAKDAMPGRLQALWRDQTSTNPNAASPLN